MKKFLIALTLLIATPVMALDVNIATGKQGGGYDAAAKNLAQRLGQRGFDVTVENLDGSDAITLALCNGSAQVGIAQVDAVDARAAEGCSLKPVGNYGEEVAVILFPPKSSLNELDDMGESQAILVDTIGSGTDLFWHTIVRIENSEDGNKSAWAKVKPVNEPIELAETSASFGDIDAVLLVRKLNSPDITNLLARGWRLGELYDKDINDYQFNGSSLYEPSRVQLRSPAGKARGYGYKVRSYYLTTQELASDRQAFATIAGAAR